MTRPLEEDPWDTWDHSQGFETCESTCLNGINKACMGQWAQAQVGSLLEEIIISYSGQVGNQWVREKDDLFFRIIIVYTGIANWTDMLNLTQTLYRIYSMYVTHSGGVALL